MGGSQDVDGGTITKKSTRSNKFGLVRLKIYLSLLFVHLLTKLNWQKVWIPIFIEKNRR
jgi:hypothetical protein